MMNDRIGVEDLVNVGIFTALYFVMFFISGMSGLIPVMAVFYPALLAILGGIPCILFFTKTQKFGLVTIMGALLGLITFLMGYGPYAIATGVGCGLIADLVLKAGGQVSKLEAHAGRLLHFQRVGRWLAAHHVHLQGFVSCGLH